MVILKGFRGTVLRKDFPRIVRLSKALDARIRGLGLQAPEEMVDLLQWCHSHTVHMSETSNGASADSSDSKQAYVIVNEGTEVPEEGIEFDVPTEHVGRMTKSLLQSIRRLHINSGHPPNADLERVVRLAGGSQDA